MAAQVRAGPTVTVYDPSGRVVPPAAINRVRRMALNGSSQIPYDAADYNGAHLASWRPVLPSADGELNPYRDTIVARVRDLVRNDGWAAGTVTRITDAAVGANFRAISKPDYRFLARETGIGAFDKVWAREFANAVDANWRSWAEDPGLWCDVSRQMTINQMMRVAFRHELIDGEALALLPVLPGRVGLGRARYASAVQLVDPDRLSNPYNAFDTATCRGGVELDGYGAAEGYQIRKAHQNDWWAAADSMTWVRVPRETAYGRPMVVHHFVPDRAGQHRGGAGIFTPVIQRLKMLIKYDGPSWTRRSSTRSSPPTSKARTTRTRCATPWAATTRARSAASIRTGPTTRTTGSPTAGPTACSSAACGYRTCSRARR